MLLKHNIALTGCGKYVVVFIVINIVFLRLCARKYGEYLHWWDTFCRYFYQSYLRHSCTTLIMFAGCVRACVRARLRLCTHNMYEIPNANNEKRVWYLMKIFGWKQLQWCARLSMCFLGLNILNMSANVNVSVHTHAHAHASAPLMMRKKWLAASWLSTF